MNTKRSRQPNWIWRGLFAVALAAAFDLPAADSPTPKPEAPARVGVYDSRAVAYAHFWTPEHQRRLTEQTRTAREAASAGDKARAEKLKQELKAQQRTIHRQVFSTAPADQALATLTSRLATLQKEQGLAAIVSKWDTQALKPYPANARLDVTDLLVREFKPADKQRRVIADLLGKPPIPLDKVDRIEGL